MSSFRPPWRRPISVAVAVVAVLLAPLAPFPAVLALPERLSIVLVTSPIPSHPSTQLVDSVIESFDLIHSLQDCPLIIVADGITIRDGKPLWNQGKVNAETGKKYRAYVDALRAKWTVRARSGGCKVLGPLEKRVNFAYALLEGLEQVETDYVLVVQHDRVFSESFPMTEVVRQLDRYPELRYVGFPTVPDYTTYAASKYGAWVRDDGLDPSLIPCFMWYDSTHVGRRDQLADLIRKEVKPGEFIESSYGCRMLAEIRESAHEWTWDYHMKNYGVFLYRDFTLPGRPLVRHVSGRSFLSREERLRRGYPAERPLISRRVKEDLTQVLKQNLKE